MTTFVRELVQIAVTGVVQGVGFRPFVYGLAQRWGITGWVLNHSGGGDHRSRGPARRAGRLHRRCAARLRRWRASTRWRSTRLPRRGTPALRSAPRKGAPASTCPCRPMWPPAPSACARCSTRRTAAFATPLPAASTVGRVTRSFPRYLRPRPHQHGDLSAVPGLPTRMCGRRRSALSRPAERLPGLRTAPEPGGRRGAASLALPPEDSRDALACAAQMLAEGAVLAIKGLGGFHLACDATNAEAVATLRRRKARPHKPLAVMMTDLATVRQHCLVNAAEAQLLAGPEAPIVLLPWRSGSTVTEEVAPGQRFLGVMLPTTPLYHVLARDVGRPLVMTSGNLSEEPLAAENDEALERLAPLADALLLHDRRIQAAVTIRSGSFPMSLVSPCRSRSAGHGAIRAAAGAAAVRGPDAGLRSGDQEHLLPGPRQPGPSCRSTSATWKASPPWNTGSAPGPLSGAVRDRPGLRRDRPAPGRRGLAPGPQSRRARGAARRGGAASPRPPGRLPGRQRLAPGGWPGHRRAWTGRGYGADGHIWGGEWLVGDYAGAARRDTWSTCPSRARTPPPAIPGVRRPATCRPSSARSRSGWCPQTRPPARWPRCASRWGAA